MEAAEKTGMSMGHQIHARSGESDEMAMSGMNPAGSISFPRIRGGIVTRMTILPVSGVITEINIETSESTISFPEEVRFDLNARINLQRIVLVGGPAHDHQ
jgi:hypothetical protein